MITRRRVTVGIAITAIVLVGFAAMEICRGSRSFLAGFDREMQARYEEIQVGENKQATIDALGPPRAESDVFNLPQRHGFEHFFDVAERSSAVKYYQWINGVNWYYCIGFNSAGEVVIKGEGHS